MNRWIAALLSPISISLIVAHAAAQEGQQGPPVAEKPALRSAGKFVLYTDAVRKAATPGRRLGRVDIDQTIARVKQSGVEAYNFILSHGPNDWEDFKLMLPAARRVGLKMWVSFLPPTMGGNSLPYKGDWSTWCKEFAKLAKEHKNFVGVHIPELQAGRNMRYLRGDNLADLRKTLNGAGLRFYVMVYDLLPRFAAQYAKSVDGVVLVYTNTRKIQNLKGMLSGARAIAPDGWKIYAAFFAAPIPGDHFVPEPIYLYYAMRFGLDVVDGLVVRDLDLKAPSNMRPGKAGISNLLYTVRDFTTAKLAGRTPPPPTYQ